MSFLLYTEFLKLKSTELFHFGTNDTDRYLIEPAKFVLGSGASMETVQGFLNIKVKVRLKDQQKELKISQLLMRQRTRVYNVARDRVGAESSRLRTLALAWFG